MKSWIGLVLIFTPIVFCSCFDMPSVYPLYTDQTAVAEPRLVGAWQTKDGNNQMFIKLTGDRRYRLTYLDDGGEASLWEFRVVKLGETSLADMMRMLEGDLIPLHHFLALSFDGGLLKVWFLDSSPLRERAGREGLAYVRDKKDEVVLTATTGALIAFLKRNLADEMKKDTDQEFLLLK